MNFAIAFENDFLIILDKPSGVLSVPGRFQDDDRPCLGRELQNHLKLQIFPVHRLDFEVSGLVIYAKSAGAHRAANSWFEKKQIQKTYRAFTTGPDFSQWPDKVPRSEIKATLQEGQRFEWKCKLLRGKRRSFESPQGQHSVTLAEFKTQDKRMQSWDLNPVTGRSHQLRYELARHGYPIIGDSVYGSRITFGPDAIALRAYKIDFSNCDQVSRWNLPEVLEIQPSMAFAPSWN